MMEEKYRNELGCLRVSAEGKRVLVDALTGSAGAVRPPRRRYARMVVALAAVACALVLAVGAAVVASPVLRDYLGGGAGYSQSAGVVNRSVTTDGWTMTITDCVGDDRRLYLGLELTAPEGTVLDTEETEYDMEYEFKLKGQVGSQLVCIPSDVPNKLQFALVINGLSGKGTFDGEETLGFNGQKMTLTLGPLTHYGAWNEEKQWPEIIYDTQKGWNFSPFQVTYPDNAIRYSPDLPISYLGKTVTLSYVEVTPLGYLVRIEGDALKGHHDWVPKDAPDGYWGCIEHLEVSLYDRDGTLLPPPEHGTLGGCSGGSDATEAGIVYVNRGYGENLLDLDALGYLEVCGVTIPLH